MLLLFFCSGCGFQLNRHQFTLLENAHSVAIAKIDNRSFVPQIDVALRDQLVFQLSQRGVPPTTLQQADLILSIFIDTASYSRSEYALDGTQQIYEFRFITKGKLSVIKRKTGAEVLVNSTIGGVFSLKTPQTDLTSLEIEQGRQKSIEALSTEILSKLTSDF